MSATPQAVTAAETELVVLLDPTGQPCGTADKATVHGEQTPYHLAFSCYVFDRSNHLLVTRRALSKRTWPGVWTNSCCGHPGPAEEPELAVRRRLRDELGLTATSLVLALPDFSYRATLDGVEEHELCPVYLARVEGDPAPNPDEVDDYEWSTFEQFAVRPDLSPWAALQVGPLAPHVTRFLAGR
jgi:isopentenyl-diphosphate delta-isomerase